MEHTVKVTTTGSAGSAIGTTTGDEPLDGFITGVRVHYHDNAPGTTTVSIVESGGLSQTILTLSARNKDTYKYPVVQLDDTTGAAIADVYGRIHVARYPIAVTVEHCDALTDAVTVTVYTSRVPLPL